MDERLSELRKVFDDAHKLWRDDRSRLSGTVTRGSPRARDMDNHLKGANDNWGSAPIEGCTTAIFLGMDVVVDYLLSLGRLWRLPVPYYGPRALLRCSLESAAYVNWLTDPEIDTQTRITRHYARQLRSSALKVRYLNRNDHFSPLADKWKAIHLEEVAAARNLNLEVKEGKTGLFSIRDDMPSTSDLIDMLIPELGFFYGGLSEYVHGDIGLLQDRQDDPIIASIEAIEQNSFIGLQTYAAACTCIARYCGSKSARRSNLLNRMIERAKPRYLSSDFNGPYLFTRPPHGSAIHQT